MCPIKNATLRAARRGEASRPVDQLVSTWSDGCRFRARPSAGNVDGNDPTASPTVSCASCAATPVGQAERIVTAFPAVPCPRVPVSDVPLSKSNVPCVRCAMCDVQCHRGMCIGQGSSHSVQQQRSVLAACGNNIVLTCCTFDHILFQLGEFF